jgi:hypothetical protein
MLALIDGGPAALDLVLSAVFRIDHELEIMNYYMILLSCDGFWPKRTPAAPAICSSGNGSD